GAPGDRRDAHGKLWLSYPRPSSRTGIDLPLDIKPKLAKGGDWFSFNADSYKIEATDTPWVFTSGVRGLSRADIPLIGKGQPAANYTVRLYFSALENDQPGQRVFDIQFQGKTVAKDFDQVAKAGGTKRAFMAEFRDVHVSDNLALELLPRADADSAHQPLLCGIEILRSDAKEITAGVAAR
ncbi:MAG: malectin domain-containing carbohydrate-binding protein, partial [Chthoniobacteraceae bacterium]